MADNVKPLRQTGGGYPGRPALDAADARLRAQLRRLTRDPDTIDQARQLCARATQALEEIHAAALKVEEESPRGQALMAREQRKMDAAFRRAGITPEPRRDHG